MARVVAQHVILHGTYMGESEKAVKFRADSIDGVKVNEPQSTWFPISQIHSQTHDPNSTGNDALIVTDWIARMKGLV